MKKRTNNFGLALFGGILVFLAGAGANYALLSHDKVTVIHLLIASCVTGLTAMVIVLVLQLRHEGQHNLFAMEKAAIMAEVNHNVRNAVFPLFLAVQRSADAESDRLANEALARLNIALRDAAVDAYSGKVNYSEETPGRAAVA